MRFGPDDAPAYTRKAATRPLRRLWARVANAEMLDHGEERRAIRSASAAVKRAADGRAQVAAGVAAG